MNMSIWMIMINIIMMIIIIIIGQQLHARGAGGDLRGGGQGHVADAAGGEPADLIMYNIISIVQHDIT